MYSIPLSTERDAFPADLNSLLVPCVGAPGPRWCDAVRAGGVAIPSAGTERRHLAYVRIEPPRRAAGEREPSGGVEWMGDADFLLACARVTTRVERCPPGGALLDLGVCTDGEARDALAGLLDGLAAAGVPARVGIGPGFSLAQLALLRAPARVAFAGIAPAAVPAFVSRVPVTLLPRLHPQGAVTPEIVERLRRYGLHTLGHVARLGEPALRRQFGLAGAALAALAAGRDPRSLVCTPLPERLRFRLRFPDVPATPERALLALPGFVARVAAHLRLTGRRARELRLTVRWEQGGREQVRCILRGHTDDTRLLTDAARRLLLPLLERGDGGRRDERAALLDELRLTLRDFVPAAPEQHSFWRTDAQCAAALDGIADMLAHRYGRPILLHPHPVAPDAVLVEERHRLLAASSHAAMSVSSATQRPARRRAPDRNPYEGSEDAWRHVPVRLHWW